jgi:signal transduction histidine kinase/ligand-binding sensor domain-containing protein
MKRFFLILYLSLFMSVIAHAQQPFVQYHTSDVYKAASLQNWYIKPDFQDNIFIANNEGVLKYDGTKWDMFALPNKNIIHSMAPDTLGNIYVGTTADVGYFRKDSTGQYKYHSLQNQIPEPYNNSTIYLIVVYKKAIFFQTDDFILRYENQKFYPIDAPNQGLVKVQNRLYLVRDNEMLLYKDGKFEHEGFSDELNKISIRWLDAYDTNSLIILDQQQRIWTLDITPGAKGKLKLFPNELKSHARGQTFTVLRTLDNGMIAISSDEEIAFMNRRGNITSTLNVAALGDFVTPGILFKDTQRNLWISSDNALIQIITSSPLTFYDKRNGLQNQIVSLGKSGSNLYVGTASNLYYKNTSDTFIPIQKGGCSNFLNLDGRIYAAHNTGVYELQGAKAVQIVSHQEAYVLCKVRNHTDRMIMGAADGLFLLKKVKNTWKKILIKGFDDTGFFLAEEDGYLWSSHRQKGVYKIQLNKEMDEAISVSFYDMHHGLPSNLNNRVYQLTPSSIIVTTTDGLYRYNKTKDRFEPDSKTHALLDNFCIYSVAKSAEGDIYFWGAKPGHQETAGVLKIQRDGTYKIYFTPFNKVAIPIRDLRIGVHAPILITGPEDILIGNELRLLQYNPNQKTFYNDPVYTSIHHVWAKDSLIYTGNQNSHHPAIAHSYNSLKFDFSSSFYEDAEKTVYQHKLEGFENEWSEWSDSHEATYTNIPGGTYTFLVRSKNIYEVISEPAAFTFTIQFPWYQKWWAYILYFILLTVIIWTIIYYYTQQIRLQKKLLQRMVDKKTKDLIAKNQEILNKNEEISMQAESLENLNLTKDKIFSIISHDLRGPIHQVQQMLNLLEYTYITEGDFKNVLPDLKESVRYTVSLTDNLLHWARNQMEGVQVKPSVFDIHEIVEENFRLFRPLASRKNIELVNTFDNHYQVFADKDMIKLVIRNLVNNAIKFTNAHGRVEMGAKIQATFVIAYITDTGKGIPKEDVSKILNKETFTTSGTQGERGVGLGLSLCQEFIERNAGHLYIESELGKGSKFSFTIPVSAANP